MSQEHGCGRYTLKAKAKDLQKRYDLANEPPEIETSYDMRPTQTLPVVISSEAGELELEMMRWGLVPAFWSKDKKIPFNTFNARDDRVFSSGMWRAVYRRRALVPATGFFEWTKPEKPADKQKFYFRPRDLEIFSFAGFYDTWKDAEGRDLESYTLITTEPNKEMRPIHNRMPVILRPEDESAWLEPSRTKREDIEPFLHPLEDNGLEVVEVGRDVKDLAYDDEHLIAPLNSQ